MNLSELQCPNCNLLFSNNIQFNKTTESIMLDKLYYYDFYSLFCCKCNKQIRLFYINEPVLWIKQEQYCYNKFVINKDKTNVQNKQYLYFYFPYDNQNIIKSLITNININKFNAIIIPQIFKKYFNINKELCIIPQYLFEQNFETIFPNYFVECIILNQVQHFLNAKIYTTYKTFFDSFKLIYSINDWEKLKQKLKLKE